MLLASPRRRPVLETAMVSLSEEVKLTSDGRSASPIVSTYAPEA